MHLHLPKPLHGWREFIGEVGIIVMGVLIALTAENVVERRHWQEQTELTRDALKAEIYDGSLNALERVALAECLRGRLRDLMERVNAPGEAVAGAPQPGWEKASIRKVVPPAYAPPSRNFLTDAWKNALASGSFNHLPAAEAAGYSEVFGSIDTLDAVQRAEASAATRLAPLSFERRLDERSRADFVASIAEVDRTSALMITVAEQMLQQVRTMHLGFDRAAATRDRERMLATQRRYRGACVREPAIDLG